MIITHLVNSVAKLIKKPEMDKMLQACKFLDIRYLCRKLSGMPLQRKQKLMLFPKTGKIIFIVFVLITLLSGWKIYQYYGYIFRPNVQKDFVLYVKNGTTFKMVYETLDTNQVLGNMKAFSWVAKRKKCRDYIKPGRYHLKEGMNTNEAVNILRAGLQDPVMVIFNNIRTKNELASEISRYIEADSVSILELFNPETISDYGFTPETFPAMFIPNTYEFYWTTTAREFADRMKLEYDRFWNEERKKKAAEIGMTPDQVATLASIVQEETNQISEKARVAGVYINRLHKGMLLQADPTVKYAVGDVTLRRVLNRHLETISPYNTYLVPGLPPGPITFPEISSLNAVLNFEKHNWLYFCAREDFSGFHNFARTNAEHERNAAKYHAALNEMKLIKKPQ
jgi:UPF0755 protein